MFQNHICDVVTSPTAKTEEPPHIRIDREGKTFLRESVIPCWQIKAVSVSSCPSSLLPWSLSISPRGVNTRVSAFNWASTPNLTFMGITSANLHSKPGRYSSLSHCGQEKLSDLLTVPKPRLQEGSLILSPGSFYSSTPSPHYAIQGLPDEKLSLPVTLEAKAWVWEGVPLTYDLRAKPFGLWHHY